MALGITMPTYLANTANFSESEPEDEEVYEELSHDVIIAIFLMMIGFVVIGLFGNSCVIYIVLRNRSMRNRPNALVASLAIGDVLLLILHVLPRVYTAIGKDWPFGQLMCKLSHASIIISQAVSILSMVALSHDRYRAIVTPMNSTVSRGASRTGIVISVIWLISILMSSPSIIFAHVITHVNAGSFCVYVKHTSVEGRVHAALRGLLLFVVPLMVITVYYCLVARKLIMSTRAMPGEVHDKRSQISSRKRLAYVVLAIIILFVVCWLPFFVFELMFQINDAMFTRSNTMTLVRVMGEMLTYIYSCINPILIFVVSSTYRKYLRAFLCCRNFDDSQKGRLQGARSSIIFSKSSSARATRMTELA